MPKIEHPRLLAVIDAAVELTVFVKMHEYPKEMSDDFFELTKLCDRQETALRAAGYLPKGKISNQLTDGSR